MDQRDDYVLGLKGNQGALHEAVEDFFSTARTGHFAGVAHDFFDEYDKDHGRLETRRYGRVRKICVSTRYRELEGVAQYRNGRTGMLHEPRKLSDWLNPTGEKKAHSLVDKEKRQVS